MPNSEQSGQSAGMSQLSVFHVFPNDFGILVRIVLPPKYWATEFSSPLILFQLSAPSFCHVLQLLPRNLRRVDHLVYLDTVFKLEKCYTDH